MYVLNRRVRLAIVLLVGVLNSAIASAWAADDVFAESGESADHCRRLCQRIAAKHAVVSGINVARLRDSALWKQAIAGRLQKVRQTNELFSFLCSQWDVTRYGVLGFETAPEFNKSKEIKSVCVLLRGDYGLNAVVSMGVLLRSLLGRGEGGILDIQGATVQEFKFEGFDVLPASPLMPHLAAKGMFFAAVDEQTLLFVLGPKSRVEELLTEAKAEPASAVGGGFACLREKLREWDWVWTVDQPEKFQLAPEGDFSFSTADSANMTLDVREQFRFEITFTAKDIEAAGRAEQNAQSAVTQLKQTIGPLFNASTSAGPLVNELIEGLRVVRDRRNVHVRTQAPLRLVYALFSDK